MQVRPGLLLLLGPSIAFFIWRRRLNKQAPGGIISYCKRRHHAFKIQAYDTTLHKHEQSMEASSPPSQSSLPAAPAAGDESAAPSALISATSTNQAPPTSTPPRQLPLLHPTSPTDPSSSTTTAFFPSTPCKTPRTSGDDDGEGFSTPIAPTTGALHSTGSALHHNHHRRHSHSLQHSPSPSSSQPIKPDSYEERDRDQDCPICMSPLASRSIYKTRCSHRFHKSCLVESRAAHINGCPFCRGEITPGLTPFDACLGRVLSEREQIISRARTARQAVLARMQQRGGGREGGREGGGRSLAFSVLSEEEVPYRGRRGLEERFETEALEGEGEGGRERGVRRVVMALTTEDLGHRIDHEGDLPF